MRVLHAAALLLPPAGVMDQMQWEQDAAIELQLPWDVRVYCLRSTGAESAICRYSDCVRADRLRGVRKAIAWWVLRWEYYSWLKSQLSDYDVVVLRYSTHDPLQLAFMRQAHKPVYLVHHTLAAPELAAANGWAGKLRAALDNLLGPMATQTADGTIGVTDEIATYELARASGARDPALVYPNGIMYKDAVVGDSRTQSPQLLFVASQFARWHGLDLLLESIRQYNGSFTLHIVGDVSDADKRLAKDDVRVILHGRRSHIEISVLASQCTIGLSSFALDRNGMREACTLKVRQYLMLGLPVYAGYRDVFPENFPYYRQGPCDIRAILSFAATHAKVSREAVSAAARQYIDKQELLHHLYEQLRGRWTKQTLDVNGC